MPISRIVKLCLLGCCVSTNALAADLTLRVEEVGSSQGQILASLCDDPKQPFPGACHAYVAKAPAQAGTTELVFRNVAPGTYALQVTHDENGNGRPDFPKESFAFGNDAPFPPGFDGAAIKVSGDTSTHVRLVHMLSNGYGVATRGVPPLPGVTKTDVRDNGLYGELYVPTHTTKLPLLIAIGGSEGGLDIMSGFAQAFTQHGYAVLALAWWKEPGLPQTIENVPLEYFDRAIAWGKAQADFAPGHIGMMGWSRGAEAALLVAARNRDVSSVIAIAPTSIVWAGLDFANPGASKPAWTVAGTPLPWVTPERVRPGAPFAEMFLAALTKADAQPDTAIPAEKINGSLLLLSGSDDRLWPSNLMAERLMARLRDHRFPHIYEHKNYDGAGHSVFVGDPALSQRSDSASVEAFMGGSADANNAARADSWLRILRFLDTTLKPKG
jgi:dienelactone hydrolase/uncharacterized protein (DUF2141 family)